MATATTSAVSARECLIAIATICRSALAHPDQDEHRLAEALDRIARLAS
jgi:hypothetical protein